MAVFDPSKKYSSSFRAGSASHHDSPLTLSSSPPSTSALHCAPPIRWQEARGWSWRRTQARRPASGRERNTVGPGSIARASVRPLSSPIGRTPISSARTPPRRERSSARGWTYPILFYSGVQAARGSSVSHQLLCKPTPLNRRVPPWNKMTSTTTISFMQSYRNRFIEWDENIRIK